MSGLDFEAPAVDAAQMRRAGRELLSLALMDARNHTLRWLAAYEAALPDPTLAVPPGPDLNPPLWVVGRIGWFQEYWISRNVQRHRGEQADPRGPRLASIDASADAWYDAAQVPHAKRWQLGLPDANATRQYLVDTLETTLELLDHAAEDDDALYFFRLALFHEDQQCEALAEMSQTLGFDAQLLPPLATQAPREPLLFPAMRFRMGSAPGAFAFDLERPQHEVALPEFEIDAQPVSWAQYCEFVEDGGYDEQAFWSEDGWTWVQREGRRTPRHVDQMRQAVLLQRFGKLTRAPLPQPAMHVSWHEAQAWCRWAGRRLPAEVEWEAAALNGASRGWRHGQVWEWTAGSARPYPGHRPGPAPDALWGDAGSRPDAKVLRGGSFATRERLRHPRLRRPQPATRDDAFCGFRSCAL